MGAGFLLFVSLVILNLNIDEYSIDMWMFPKIGGKPPKSSILIGFSIINYNPSILGGQIPLCLEGHPYKHIGACLNPPVYYGNLWNRLHGIHLVYPIPSMGLAYLAT